MHVSREERARALALLALALPAAAPPAALGQEPPSYGHRIGLSQYGAAARAGAGHDATAILDFYYPGTGRASTAPATIRVLLYDRHRVVVRRAPGLRRTVFAARGGVVTRAGRSTGRRAVVVRGPFCLRSCYRGVLVLSVRPDGSLRAVNRVGIEAYLRSVVPSEMSSGWPFEALRAQAVAARSYAWANLHPRRSWDVWQDTRSQAYWGIPWETARTDQAVASTAYRVRTWRGAPILAMYTAANGGWTRGYPGYPYLITRRDRFDEIGRGRYHEGAPVPPVAGEADD